MFFGSLMRRERTGLSDSFIHSEKSSLMACFFFFSSYFAEVLGWTLSRLMIYG